jgi:hypothetical protein
MHEGPETRKRCGILSTLTQGEAVAIIPDIMPVEQI